MKEIKLVIFDLWNTLAYHPGHKGSLKDLCKMCYPNNYRKFLKTYEKHLQRSKNITFEQGFQKVFKELKIKRDVNEFAQLRKKYESNFKFYAYVLPLIKKLKKQKIKTALLSNTSKFLGDKIKKTPVCKNLNKCFFSYELKVIKPSPNAFKIILKHFNVKPEETLMIGDNKIDDYQAAKKLKINAIHFKNSKQLKKELKKYEI